jgi:hypothetical protein
MLGQDALSMREHGATLHGFRSTLSTWAEEQDDGRAYPRAVIKAVLAHGNSGGRCKHCRVRWEIDI